MQTPSEPEHSYKRRPLWPWVVGAIVLCLFGAGFWFWWPMYRASSLVKSIRDRGGDVQYEVPSSLWKSVFGDQFHPWYHEVYAINMYDASGHLIPLNDSDVTTITNLRGIRQLTLDLSENPPAVVRELECLSGIKSLTLAGNGRPIPIDWIRSFPALGDLTLIEVEIDEDGWRDVISTTAPIVQIFDCSLDVTPVKSSSVKSLHLGGLDLDEKAADAIASLSLSGLSLHTCSADDRFWTALARHPTLEKLAVVDTRLNDAGLLKLSNLSTLKSIRLSGSKISSSGRTEFLKTRPDVELFR